MGLYLNQKIILIIIKDDKKVKSLNFVSNYLQKMGKVTHIII